MRMDCIGDVKAWGINLVKGGGLNEESTTDKHKMTKNIVAPTRKFLQPLINGFELVQIQDRSDRHTGGGAVLSRGSSVFSHGCLLHWRLDKCERSVILFLAEGGTRTPAAASVRCETGLLPTWGHRIKVRHPALMNSGFRRGRRR